MRSIFLFLTLAAMVSAQAAEQNTSDIARSVFQNEIKKASVQPSAATAVGEGSTRTGNPAAAKSSAGNSINPAAQEAKKSQNAGAMINMAAGAALITACMASSPPNWALCANGALALAQGAADKSAAGESAATFDASQFDPAIEDKPTYSDPQKGESAFTNPKVQEGLAAMKEAGYSVTEKGVKLPDGSFVPASAVGSGASASAFGAGAVREAQMVTAAVNDEISKMGVSGVAVNSGGGGSGMDGGAGEGSASTDESSSSANGGMGVGGFAGDRKRLMAGKTVNFDGEPIGVRGNNIFEMVHACYQKKRAGNQFIEGVSAGGALRAPASIRPKNRK